MVDDYRNLIYINKSTHKKISRSGNKHVVLGIDENTAQFQDFEQSDVITATNEENALYSREIEKVQKMSTYNVDLLKSIFEFEI